MYFVAEIKPTSTLHLRWSNRNLRCGVLQGVGFVRKGRTYVAEKVTPEEMETLKREVAVRFAATTIRTVEKFADVAPVKAELDIAPAAVEADDAEDADDAIDIEDAPVAAPRRGRPPKAK